MRVPSSLAHSPSNPDVRVSAARSLGARSLGARSLGAHSLGAAVTALLLNACGAEPTPEAPAPLPPEDAATIARPSDRRPNTDADEDSGSTGGGGADQPGSSGSGDADSDAEPTPPSDTPTEEGTGGSDATEPEQPTPPLLTARSSADDSLLYVMVWRDPNAIGNGFAHDHVVRATSWAGTLQFRQNDPSACFVDIDVETGALLNDEPAMRSEVGLPDSMSESDRVEVRNTMLGDGQLEAEQFPTLSFTSVACSGDLDGLGTLEIDGDLTIRGETQPVTWSVDYEVDSSGQMFATGSITVAQRAFGITPYSAFFGAVKVADEVDIVFDLVGLPNP